MLAGSADFAGCWMCRHLYRRGLHMLDFIHQPLSDKGNLFGEWNGMKLCMPGLE